jgi:hypothetical protein
MRLPYENISNPILFVLKIQLLLVKNRLKIVIARINCFTKRIFLYYSKDVSASLFNDGY